MRIVGHVLIGVNQQRSLKDGDTLEMPLQQFRATVKARARVGDLVWVKEPWCMLMPMGLAVPGHFVDLMDNITATLKKAKRKVEWHSTGIGLHCKESRFTFEIMGFLRKAQIVRFLVHLCQVDKFLAARRAAA